MEKKKSSANWKQVKHFQLHRPDMSISDVHLIKSDFLLNIIGSRCEIIKDTLGCQIIRDTYYPKQIL